MSKKIMKVTTIMLLTVMVIFAMSNILYANAGRVGNVDIIVSDSANGKIGTVGSNILGIIRVVGTLISVGTLMIIGIKYMMGSAEEKAEYKKVMLPYLIGAVLLFAAVNLAGWIAGFAGTIA